MRLPFVFVLFFVFIILVVAKVFFFFVIKFWFLALPIAGYLGYKVYKFQRKFIANQSFVNKQSDSELDPDKQVKGGSYKVVK